MCDNNNKFIVANVPSWYKYVYLMIKEPVSLKQHLALMYINALYTTFRI